MNLRGATALVTGASSGIGAATARALARHGARALLLARTSRALESVVSSVRRAGGQAEAHPVDLSDAQAVDRLFDVLDARGLRPGIVVNSAGAGRWLFTEETSPAEMVQQMAVPYFAAFYVTRRCLPAMLAARAGHIVNVNSPVARIGRPATVPPAMPSTVTPTPCGLTCTLGDGVYSGPYAAPDALMDEIFDACVADILERPQFA